MQKNKKGFQHTSARSTHCSVCVLRPQRLAPLHWPAGSDVARRKFPRCYEKKVPAVLREESARDVARRKCPRAHTDIHKQRVLPTLPEYSNSSRLGLQTRLISRPGRDPRPPCAREGRGPKTPEDGGRGWTIVRCPGLACTPDGHG